MAYPNCEFHAGLLLAERGCCKVLNGGAGTNLQGSRWLLQV